MGLVRAADAALKPLLRENLIVDIGGIAVRGWTGEDCCILFPFAVGPPLEGVLAGVEVVFTVHLSSKLRSAKYLNAGDCSNFDGKFKPSRRTQTGSWDCSISSNLRLSFSKVLT